jgi:hypothetical protein
MNEKISVACPFCRAAVGVGCVNNDGTAFKTGIHMARYYVLQEVKRAAS